MRQHKIYLIFTIAVFWCLSPVSGEHNQLGQPWEQSVSEGVVSGYSFIEKFGENPDIDTTPVPESLWDYSVAYTFSTSADIDRISSSNDSDTQDIAIQGLDENWEFVEQTITLTGQTPAALTTNLIRVFRAYNMSSTEFAGDVYIFVNSATSAGVPDVAANVRAMIRAFSQQTLMCIYTIPAGKTGYFYGGYVSLAKSSASGTTFASKMRLFGGVPRIVSIITVIGTGRSSWDYAYPLPLALPEKTDLWLDVIEAEANNTAASGGFTILLKDN